MRITHSYLRDLVREFLQNQRPIESFLVALSGDDYLIDNIVRESLKSFNTKEVQIFEDIDHWTRRAANKIRRSSQPPEEISKMQIAAMKYLIHKISEKANLNRPGLSGRVDGAQNIRQLAHIVKGLFFNPEMGLTGPLSAVESMRLKRLIIRNMSAVKQ